MPHRLPAATFHGANRGRRRRRRIAVLAALAVGGAALLAPKPAEAGSYMVRQCSAGNPGSDAGWERTSEHYRGRNRCGSGGGLQVHHDADAAAHRRYGAWAWRAPAGTTFTSLRINASLTRHAGHRGELWAVPADGPAHRFGREHEAFRVYERRGEFSRFDARLRCARSSGCKRGGDGAQAHVKGVFLRITDRTSPTVTMAGELLGDRVVRGSRPLSLDATDDGGGVRRVWIEANDVPLTGAVRDCQLAGGSATKLVPCPGATTESRTVNTTHPAFVTGPNVVAACAEDLALAGRPNRGCERRRLWVDNVCPASAAGGVNLDAAFAGGGTRAVVRSNRRAMLRGRLTDDVDGPVSGATICVLSRVERDEAPVTIAASERTGADGRYAIEVPAGPNRQVFVHHVGGTEVIARHGLAIRSRVRPTLGVRAPRRARRGDWLRFRGRLPGPACAARLVEVQARLAKRRWQVFRTGRTDGRCRFATRYRLRATTGPTRYRFRARVRRQLGYPYAPGTSAVRTKRVLGPRR